jgi:hypothetical protein
LYTTAKKIGAPVAQAVSPAEKETSTMGHYLFGIPATGSDTLLTAIPDYLFSRERIPKSIFIGSCEFTTIHHSDIRELTTCMNDRIRTRIQIKNSRSIPDSDFSGIPISISDREPAMELACRKIFRFYNLPGGKIPPEPPTATLLNPHSSIIGRKPHGVATAALITSATGHDHQPSIGLHLQQ